MKLLYVMDPMCAWCYAFQPELEKFLDKHTELKIDWVMGGLAPDNQTPMNDQLRLKISSYWHKIEALTGVTFNHDYWKLNTPYRSTYPACRAVIAAKTINQELASKMAKRIQAAYYLEAKNPSLEKTILDCARSIGLDISQFSQIYKSDETEKKLQENISLCKKLEVRGFPTLFYVDEKKYITALTRAYCSVSYLKECFDLIKNQ